MIKSGEVNALTATAFDQLLNSSSIVFVDFWASWCVPCVHFSALFKRVAQQYPAIVFATIDIQQEAALAETFQIRSIPYLMVFKQGIAIYAESGSMPESTLHELVEQAIAADISGIRQQLDAEKG